MSKTSSGKAKRQLRVQRVVSRATVETYYAVRIGTPGRNAPYFMVREDVTNGKYTPWLFTTRADAEAQCPKQPVTRVVKVRVSHG